jgi:hypothetical protein
MLGWDGASDVAGGRNRMIHPKVWGKIEGRIRNAPSMR